MAFHKIKQSDNEEDPCQLVFSGEEGEQGFYRGKWFASCRNPRIASKIVELWNRNIDEKTKHPPNINKPRKFR